MTPGMMGGPMGGPPPGGPMGGPPPWMDKKKKKTDNMPDEAPPKEFDLKQMEKESEEMTKMTFLNKENAHFQKTSGELLSLTFNGHNYDSIQLIETFPFTDPFSYISVRDISNKNKELGLIEDLSRDFDDATVTQLKEHLDLHYHMPQIQKILKAKESGGYTHFTVQTNFGETQFSLRSNGTYITALDDYRLIIQDAEGNRFEIPDKRLLSARDIKKLDVFM